MFGIGGTTDTLLGAGAELKGNLSVEGACVVDGRLEGNVTASERITLGAHAQVRGNLSAPEVVVGGRVEGNVRASGRCHLLSTAQVEGDIHAPRLVMAEGAHFDGRADMESPAASEAPGLEPRLARK